MSLRHASYDPNKIYKLDDEVYIDSVAYKMINPTGKPGVPPSNTNSWIEILDVYNNAIRYYAGDQVLYRGNVYKMIKSPGYPGVLPSNTANWKEIITSKGGVRKTKNNRSGKKNRPGKKSRKSLRK